MPFSEFLSLDQNSYHNFSTLHIDGLLSVFPGYGMSPVVQQWILLVATELGKGHYQSVTLTGVRVDLNNHSIIIVFYIYVVCSFYMHNHIFIHSTVKSGFFFLSVSLSFDGCWFFLWGPVDIFFFFFFIHLRESGWESASGGGRSE